MAPSIATRVPGVPLTAYSEKDLLKILKESRINAEGCTTREDMIARIKAPGEYRYPDDWVDPVELAARKEATAARRAEEAAKPDYAKALQNFITMPAYLAMQSVDWSNARNQNLLLLVGGAVLTLCWYFIEWTIAAIARRRDDTRVEDPDIKVPDAAEDGSVTAQVRAGGGRQLRAHADSCHAQPPIGLLPDSRGAGLRSRKDEVAEVSLSDVRWVRCRHARLPWFHGARGRRLHHAADEIVGLQGDTHPFEGQDVRTAIRDEEQPRVACPPDEYGRWRCHCGLTGANE